MSVKQRILKVIQNLEDDVSAEDITRSVRNEIIAIQKENGTYEDPRKRLQEQLAKTDELRERLKTSEFSFEMVQQGPGHRTMVVTEKRKKD